MDKFKNAIKFEINFQDFSTKNPDIFLRAYGKFLKHMLGVEEVPEKIDVSKVWVSEKTNDKFILCLMKSLKSKKLGRLGTTYNTQMISLQYGPAVDNTGTLEDGYIYILEDFLKGE